MTGTGAVNWCRNEAIRRLDRIKVLAQLAGESQLTDILDWLETAPQFQDPSTQATLPTKEGE